MELTYRTEGDYRLPNLEMVEQLTARMAREQGVTEELKASDQMKWVGLMNNIRAAAEEVALTELVYADT